MTGKRSRVSWWFATVLIGVLLGVVGIYAAWSTTEQRDASERKVLEEAQLLAKQMEAAWNYVDSVQDAINFNSDGRYDFKGVYCSVAGKSIALNFTRETDCVIRYTRENPRTGPDAPDEFESAALAAFEEGETEYYTVTSYEGRSAFRYASAIPIKYGCLSCHGDPAGELDETGFPKEGYQIGDLAGAVSLVIPLEQYEVEAAQRTTVNVGLFGVLALAIVVCACAVNILLSRQRAQVERMNDQLEKANEALRAESEYKSTFLATMSHELRTPLASTIALADVWAKSSEGASEFDMEIVDKIRCNSTGLLDTINNTLDAASLEANRFAVDIAPFDMLDAVNDVEQTVLPLACEKGVAFSVDIDPLFPLVATDQGIVHKVLMNLLSNAVKFTDPGGSVQLAIALAVHEDAIMIEVADTGIGIPEADLAVVFERFRQADSSISRRYGGSGLGLALVKEMAELLGGSASVESEAGVGSKFKVSIPCQVVEG